MCVSLVWLLVGQGGSESPGTCEDARDMFVAVSSALTSEQLNTVAISSDAVGSVFDEPSGGTFYCIAIFALSVFMCTLNSSVGAILSMGQGLHVKSDY